MAVPISGPVAKVPDSLRCGGLVEQATKLVGPDHAEHFRVDDMGRSVVGVVEQTLTDRFRCARVRFDLEEA